MSELDELLAALEADPTLADDDHFAQRLALATWAPVSFDADVAVAHRDAQANAGMILVTARCGVPGCGARVAVVNDTARGPLWVADVPNLSGVLGQHVTNLRRLTPNTRVPAAVMVNTWLIDYPPPSDGIEATVWARCYPPAAVCPKHGRLDADPARITAAVHDRRRNCVLSAVN